ncbi:NAD(P)-binding domain-containing protein [Shouchella sp. 1P09AA]|uniref:NAD(P)-binding domain-containing protein n=1 Tax=unclassified Shouchella TaxID=2893065 RepID=UPI0039A28A74
MKKVAIIGTGRMGEAIATHIHSGVELTLLNSGSRQGEELAQTLHAHYSTDFSVLNQVDIIFSCVPQANTSEVLEAASLHAEAQTLMINCSTKAWIATELKNNYCDLHYVEAKIIGHAGSIKAGKRAYVIAEADEDVRDKVTDIFSPLAEVVFDDPALVEELNKVATEVGIKAAVQLDQQVRDKKLSAQIKQILLENVCAGVMSAYARDDLGHFAKQIVEEIKNKEPKDERDL